MSWEVNNMFFAKFSTLQGPEPLWGPAPPLVLKQLEQSWERVEVIIVNHNWLGGIQPDLCFRCSFFLSPTGSAGCKKNTCFWQASRADTTHEVTEWKKLHAQLHLSFWQSDSWSPLGHCKRHLQGWPRPPAIPYKPEGALRDLKPNLPSNWPLQLHLVMAIKAVQYIKCHYHLC